MSEDVVMLAMAHPDFILKLETIKGEPLTAEQWEQVKRNIARSDPRLDALLAAVKDVFVTLYTGYRDEISFEALSDAFEAFGYRWNEELAAFEETP